MLDRKYPNQRSIITKIASFIREYSWRNITGILQEAFKNYYGRDRSRPLKASKDVYYSYMVESIPDSHPFFNHKRLLLLDKKPDRPYSNILEQIYGQSHLSMFQSSRFNSTLIDLLYNQRVYWDAGVEPIDKPSAPQIWAPLRKRWYAYAFYHNQPKQHNTITITEWYRVDNMYRECKVKLDKSSYEHHFGKIDSSKNPMMEYLRIWNCSDIEIDKIQYNQLYLPIVCVLRNFLMYCSDVEEWEFDALLAILCSRDITTGNIKTSQSIFSERTFQFATLFGEGIQYASLINQMLGEPFSSLRCLYCGSEFVQLYEEMKNKKQYVDYLVSADLKETFTALKQDIVRKVKKW